jgi:hypothetical protein
MRLTLVGFTNASQAGQRLAAAGANPHVYLLAICKCKDEANYLQKTSKIKSFL